MLSSPPRGLRTGQPYTHPDNTVNNRYNPDPDQWVVFGKRTADDMSHMWLGITYFDDEEAFERLVRERELLLREREQRITQAGDAGQE